MSYAPLDPKNTVMLFADLQAGIIELTCTNPNTDQESPSRDACKVHRRERVLRFVLAASVDQGRTLTSSSTWLPATTIHLIAAEVHVPSRRPRHGFETALAVQVICACIARLALQSMRKRGQKRRAPMREQSRPPPPFGRGCAGQADDACDAPEDEYRSAS